MVKVMGGWWNAVSMHVYIQEDEYDPQDEQRLYDGLKTRAEQLTSGREIVLYGVNDGSVMFTTINESDVLRVASRVARDINAEYKKGNVALELDVFSFEGHIIINCQ